MELAPQHTYGLADVLCEAPPVLALLSSQDQAALSNCSKQLQDLMHSFVTVISVDQLSDAEAAVSGSWPQLALITMKSARIDTLWLPQNSNFQLLASLWFMQDFNTSAAYIVSANTESAPRRSIAAAFRHLQKPHWRETCILFATVYSQDMEIVARMAQANWPCITALGLTHSRLGHASMLQLAKGSLPQLETLDLSGNQLDATAMTALTQGKWPSLTDLVLSSNPSLRPAAIALIPKASWVPLRKLSLANINLNRLCARSIALLHNQLQDLDLAFTNMGAAAALKLTAVSWLQLRILDLMGNNLTADAIASLVSADIPDLIDLNLSHNNLTVAAARVLSDSTWHKLCELRLNDNALDHTAMAFVSKGSWPDLHSLSLQGNEDCELGLELLMVGQWPQLSSLTLDSKYVTAASRGLFNISTPIPNCREGYYFIASQALSSHFVDIHLVWPKLRGVHFRPGFGIHDVSCSAPVGDEASKPVTSASTSIEGQDGWSDPLLLSTPYSDSDINSPANLISVNQHQFVGRRGEFWQQLMGWSSLACLDLWMLKRRQQMKFVYLIGRLIQVTQTVSMIYGCLE